MGGRNPLVILPTSTGQSIRSRWKQVNGSVPCRSAIRRHRLAGLVIAQRIARSIRFEEGIVDSEGCLHAFGSCCNDKLHTTAGISRGIKAGDVGSGVFATLNVISIFPKFAAELFCQRKRLYCPGEKKSALRERKLPSVRECRTYYCV